MENSNEEREILLTDTLIKKTKTYVVNDRYFDSWSLDLISGQYWDKGFLTTNKRELIETQINNLDDRYGRNALSRETMGFAIKNSNNRVVNVIEKIKKKKFGKKYQIKNYHEYKIIKKYCEEQNIHP
jgi:hypothetical protein